MIRAVVFDMYETLITHYDCPLYFTPEMAADCGIELERFQKTWRGTDHERTVGILTLEEVIEKILKENGVYSGELFDRVISRRIETKKECFRHLHKQIIPMLEELRKRGLKIALISNCFSEEAEVIRESVLAEYFDVMCLSYELGMKKPDLRIYEHCVKELGVAYEECLYVGDGGSNELEAAEECGMKAVQALWYKSFTSYRKALLHPLDVINEL